MAISEPRWYRIFVHTMGEGVHIIIPTALSDLCMSVCPYQPFGIKTPHTHFLQSLNLCTFKSNPITDLRRPWGFQEVKAPRFQDNRHMKVVRLSALRTGCLYPPGSIPGTRFCQRLSRPQGHSAAGRIMSMKNSNDTIGNRTRDLPTYSALPEPTALRRAIYVLLNKLMVTTLQTKKRVLFTVVRIHTAKFCVQEFCLLGENWCCGETES